MNAIVPIMILALLIVLMYLFFIRPILSGIAGMMPGMSKKVLAKKQESIVTFKDVAGIEYVKEELEEIVDLLKNPEKYTSIGARVPKGVLCVGPPGTGKTLIAKAVAGEADCSFFSVSGSEFVEVFVGVGASRIRKMFAEAKKNAPCIIFIDEIDAIGGHRGSGFSGGHSEREQTLNQLLVEMDGFEQSAGIVIIAATNRAESLDKALVRPGRFDRNVTVDLPSCDERKQILKVHLNKIKSSQDVRLDDIAKSTPGASGADLANIINESAIFAVKENKSEVSHIDIVAARDKVMFGKERRGRKLRDNDKKITAYHESGHTVASLVLEDEESNKVEKVTIIPRGPSLGATHFLPEDDAVHWSRKRMKKELVILLAGRAAEEFFIKDATSGASGDIKSATEIARSYVCKFGLDENIGMINYSIKGELVDSESVRISELTLQNIDAAVKRLIDNAKKEADNIMEEKKSEIEAIARALIKKETLYRSEVDEIYRNSTKS